MTKYNPDIHHRRSIRLKGYDYSQEGLYFVTICTQNRENLFGTIENGKMINEKYGVGADSISAQILPIKMVLNDAGKMVEKLWNENLNDIMNVNLHEYVIMPNHIHGIIEIAQNPEIAQVDFIFNKKRAEMDSAPTNTKTKTDPIKRGLSQIIQSFKRRTTIEYIKMVKQHILPSFDKRIWQRNYYEHIIRNDGEYNRIFQYIVDNPIKWQKDRLNSKDGNIVMENIAPYDYEEWMV